MPGRTFAIGDIHGCAGALATLLDALAPCPEDTVVTLGDYIDRGPDSRGVLDQLIAVATRCRLVPLLGNHEEAMSDALRDNNSIRRWLTLGGTETLRSYGWLSGGPRKSVSQWIPPEHREFIESCCDHYETATHLFVHAGYVAELPLAEQPSLALRWRVADAASAVPHCSGKIAVVGHTPQRSGDVLDLGFLICIDTNCARGGWLTALEVETAKVWQADSKGRLRVQQLGTRSDRGMASP